MSNYSILINIIEFHTFKMNSKFNKNALNINKSRSKLKITFF